MPGSMTTPGLMDACEGALISVAFHLWHGVGTQDQRFYRGSMAGLCVPLSTLRGAPRGASRMTRGQHDSLDLYRQGLSPFTPCRSPGARQRRRSEHQLPRYFAQALRLPIPRTTTVSSSTVTVRDTAVPARLSSLRIGPSHHLVVPAKARRKPGPTAPVGTGFRRCDRGGRVSNASNAPQRVRQAGKRSEAAHQATREPGSPGRPVAPPWGDRRDSAVGGQQKPGRSRVWLNLRAWRPWGTATQRRGSAQSSQRVLQPAWQQAQVREQQQAWQPLSSQASWQRPSSRAQQQPS